MKQFAIENGNMATYIIGKISRRVLKRAIVHGYVELPVSIHLFH